MKNRIVLAAVSGAHGVNGEIRLKLFGEGVESLKRFRAFTLLREASGESREIAPKTLRDDGKGGAIAKLVGVDNRNAAEALRGMVLTVSREELPPLEEGEYYHADLLGLSAVSDAGEALGTVIAIDNYGAGDVIEIERPAAEGEKPRRFMVPMRPEAVPEWDARRIVIAADFAAD
ncbi:ribosome maturation factor RimM [Croceicoccus marinus]|uniref:Ribosome maturation factor RimM n=1 Tax=Croceicoccus marinus TaxID=450378 RepID=A0A7G6VQA4_9SPHN|nr:ribosome maturation factor RimM [Croceicoccus marinus]QNE03919.1 16S rRNA processing protein RimM [Croceicoccus marinus]